MKRMMESEIQGVDFWSLNTDVQVRYPTRRCIRHRLLFVVVHSFFLLRDVESEICLVWKQMTITVFQRVVHGECQGHITCRVVVPERTGGIVPTHEYVFELIGHAVRTLASLLSHSCTLTFPSLVSSTLVGDVDILACYAMQFHAFISFSLAGLALKNCAGLHVASPPCPAVDVAPLKMHAWLLASCPSRSDTKRNVV